MTKPLKFLGAAAVLLLATNADAVVFGGTPDLGFHINRSNGDLTDGDVYVDKLRINYCTGGYTDYHINAWVDPVAGFSQTIAGGSLCSATWYWGSDLVLNGPGFEMTGTPELTTVNLNPMKTTDVLPVTVTRGSASPGTPILTPFVDD